MNRITTYLIGPELVWLLLYICARVLTNNNQPPTPDGNAQLENLQWYVALLGVLVSFIPLFWVSDHLWWWLLRIGVAGIIGVIVINLTLIGGIDYGDSRNSGIGSTLFLTVPLGGLLLLIGVGTVAVATWLKWDFRPVLKWSLILVGSLTVILLWTSCTSKTEKKQANEASANGSPSDTLTHKWSTEQCEYVSTYDPGRYTESQLIATSALWYDSWYLESFFIAGIPEDIQQLNLDTLHQDYLRTKEKLKKLTVVDVPYWKKLKEQRLQSIDSEYQLKILAINAYKNPALLRQTTYDKAAAPYVNALIAGDSTTLLSAWKQLHEDQKKTSGLPEQLEREFKKKFNSPNRVAMAQVELMQGWWRFVTQRIPYATPDAQMEKEYKALFVTTKAMCPEP
ncbi:hypothetical protein IC229_15215 [Spirosoma sp. BT702]|uniref:Uncharacterized protein n=1 Tax=Spirosoma profusum TaxID=2771354 RepID=A0A927AR98_9BACT|nr:hypothetical protein [Spirosoma profusum]MBD2701998.1 hypothetical protein [Spirosoma profusum]